VPDIPRLLNTTNPTGWDLNVEDDWWLFRWNAGRWAACADGAVTRLIYYARFPPPFPTDACRYGWTHTRYLTHHPDSRFAARCTTPHGRHHLGTVPAAISPVGAGRQLGCAALPAGVVAPLYVTAAGSCLTIHTKNLGGEHRVLPRVGPDQGGAPPTPHPRRLPGQAAH